MTHGPSFTCDSCRIRQELRAPANVQVDSEGHGPTSIKLTHQALAQLRYHAAEFDALAERSQILCTATEFIDYLEPIVRGSPRYIEVTKAMKKRDAA